MTRVPLIVAIIVSVASAGPKGTLSLPPAPPASYNACKNVLDSCQNLVDAQDQSIKNLKAYSKKLEGNLEKAEEAPLIPTWMVIAGAVIAGGVVGYALHK